MINGTVTILRQMTIELFGTDPDGLEPLSNKYVCVRCDRCDETFVRLRSVAHHPHECPVIKIEAGKMTKFCARCGSYLAIEQFANDPSQVDRHAILCSTCKPGSRWTPQPIENYTPTPVAPVRFEFMLLHPDAVIPFKSRDTDGAYDIASVEDIVVPAHGTANVSTGIAIACPPGYYFTINGRSRLWSKNVAPYRSIMDAGYHDETRIALMNISDEDYQVLKGDRIAQISAHEVKHIDFVEVTEFGPAYSIRGKAGFGSSGR